MRVQVSPPAQMKKLPLSYIEISKDNLIHNIKQFRGLVKKGTLIAGVIKANAYGHGDKEIAKILNPYVDYFQVNSIEELESVRRVTKKPVLLLGYVGKDDISKAISLGAILSVFDLEHALLMNKISQRLGKKTKVHLAVDSYLGREGIISSQIESVIPELKKMTHLIIDGVYSHFANIEDTENFSHAQKQIDAYREVCDSFRLHGFKNIKTHISATSGTLVYEGNKGMNSIVRIGIGLYGMWPSVYLTSLSGKKITLKPVMRWVTHIAQIKDLPFGYSIGYGLSYVTKNAMKVAVIPQGYSNGFDRKLSNSGEVLIYGKLAPVLGRVAMNMFVVDVSHIPDVQTGDEVVIIGSQDKAEITAERIASKVDTINYEITTRVSALLPRIVK